MDKEFPWYLTLVNYQNHIPEDYEPKLVEVQGKEQVDERIYEPLMEMLEAAREGNRGELPLVVSGYRTAEKQQSLYDEKILMERLMIFICGFRKTVINTVLFSATPEIKHRLQG